jgi:hypothetical protein
MVCKQLWRNITEIIFFSWDFTNHVLLVNGLPVKSSIRDTTMCRSVSTGLSKLPVVLQMQTYIIQDLLSISQIFVVDFELSG